jgi:PadR family transcriptional regulator, regulatory protein AphA
MAAREPRISATAYAVLGLLAQRPGSAYELTRSMQVNLDYIWPSARSHLYADLKRLAKLGLAATTREHVGERPRTRYEITPRGRKALAKWLSTRPQTFALQLEGLVRVFLSTEGTRADLLQALESMREEAERMLKIADQMVPAYLEGRAPWQDRMHVRALMIDFLTHFAELTWKWSERSIQRIDTWKDLELKGKEDAARVVLEGVPRWSKQPASWLKPAR